MSSSGFAFILAFVFLIVAAFWTSPDQPLRFLDPHGAFMVVVGTLLIAVISVPWEYIKRFFFMIRVVSRKLHDDSPEILKQLVEIGERSRTDMRRIEPMLPQLRDPFLKDAVGILMEGFEASEIERILRRSVEVQKERENADAKMFKSLGKYPPATGLIGTVMGMIALLGTLGQEGAESKIGPAMSVAMSATLYGVIIANLLVLPVGDQLLFRTQKSIAKREMIIEGILLIKQKTPAPIIREILLSHLAPHQRDALRQKASPGVRAA